MKKSELVEGVEYAWGESKWQTPRKATLIAIKPAAIVKNPNGGTYDRTHLITPQTVEVLTSTRWKNVGNLENRFVPCSQIKMTWAEHLVSAAEKDARDSAEAERIATNLQAWLDGYHAKFLDANSILSFNGVDEIPGWCGSGPTTRNIPESILDFIIAKGAED